MSALEELDKCIAEFDGDSNNNQNPNKSHVTSFTTVSDLSTSQIRIRAGGNDLSLISPYIDENNNNNPNSSRNKLDQSHNKSHIILESTADVDQQQQSQQPNQQQDAKNCSSIISISQSDSFFTPDLNNNNNNNGQVMSRADVPSVAAATALYRFATKASGIPPPPPPPLPTTATLSSQMPVTPVNEHNFNAEYRSFMLKPVKR